MPEWYPVISAARYLGVAPWELLDQPSEWQEWALAAQAAENDAREHHQRRQADAQRRAQERGRR